MANVIPVPTLSTAGWIKTPAEKIDYIMAHFYESEIDQTYIYEGNVTSLPNIIQKNYQNPVALVTELRSQLIIYLSRYFDSATVDTDFDEVDGGFDIRIYAKVTEQGKDYSVGRLIVTSGNKVKEFVRLNDVGN